MILVIVEFDPIDEAVGSFRLGDRVGLKIELDDRLSGCVSGEFGLLQCF